MKRNINSRPNRYLLRWGVIAGLAVGGLMATMQATHGSVTKEGKENAASSSRIQSPDLPAIDKIAPKNISTATFGLG